VTKPGKLKLIPIASYWFVIAAPEIIPVSSKVIVLKVDRDACADRVIPNNTVAATHKINNFFILISFLYYGLFNYIVKMVKSNFISTKSSKG
jgi:hypothetical protein